MTPVASPAHSSEKARLRRLRKRAKVKKDKNGYTSEETHYKKKRRERKIRRERQRNVIHLVVINMELTYRELTYNMELTYMMVIVMFKAHPHASYYLSCPLRRFLQNSWLCVKLQLKLNLGLVKVGVHLVNS